MAGERLNETGRRLVLVGGGRVEIETFAVPEPGPGQVLVRVHRSQVSAGSEKNAFLGTANPEARRTTGYTTVGRVLAAGPGMEEFRPAEGPLPGDRVLAFGNHGSHWLTGQAERSELTASIQRVEYEITDEQAAFAVLGDVALHGVRRAQLQIDESVAIFGQGVVGQLVTAFSRLSGAHPVIAVDLEAERLELSTRSGATHCVDASREDAVATVREITGGGAQCVFHAARDPRVLVDCMKAAGDRAKVILVGSPPGTVEIGLQVELLRRELDIRGVYERGLENNPHPYWPWTRQRNRRAVMRMIASGELRVDHLISHVAKPEEADALFRQIVAGPKGWMSIFFDWT
jgi:2-desacetyl-2-hydroxyethyl bacteriochlorophyllide A dehydrogenase